eukprot:scaffold28_cov515-Prasinococcus_capsulatus_cf.AAC.12
METLARFAWHVRRRQLLGGHLVLVIVRSLIVRGETNAASVAVASKHASAVQGEVQKFLATVAVVLLPVAPAASVMGAAVGAIVVVPVLVAGRCIVKE